MLSLFASRRFRDHAPPSGHPERPERADVMWAAAERWQRRGGVVLAPRPATPQELLRVHEEAYLDRIARTAGRAARLDPDTFTSPESRDVALLAAGATAAAVERVLAGDDDSSRAFALVRPPGHHAEAGRAMGFCLYNNAAVAAAHARQHGLARVAIVDYDVHHGNGTQWIFYDDPRVLYVSIHQFPFYPGTGSADQIGRGRGEGFTFNVPLEAGATDADYLHVFGALVRPVLEQFEPELIVVSAGFDAHERDPLAGMRLSAGGFGALTGELCAASDRWCQGRLVAVTEGGYDLDALASCLDTCIEVAAGVAAEMPPIDATPTRRALSAVAAVRAAHGARWNL